MDRVMGQAVALLELTDWRHLQSAEGYIELEMYDDAEVELEQVGSSCSELDVVLALWLCVYAGRQQWESMQSLAEEMAERDPTNIQFALCWATATRKMQSIEAAKQILLQALQMHPDNPALHYNLSCYESSLRHFNQARRHLARAIQLDPRFKQIAQIDRDLMPLWQEIAKR
jgi:tetratricopeptide (TPR) repeat protein